MTSPLQEVVTLDSYENLERGFLEMKALRLSRYARNRALHGSKI